jgi:hypothetical protein
MVIVFLAWLVTWKCSRVYNYVLYLLNPVCLCTVHSRCNVTGVYLKYIEITIIDIKEFTKGEKLWQRRQWWMILLICYSRDHVWTYVMFALSIYRKKAWYLTPSLHPYFVHIIECNYSHVPPKEFEQADDCHYIRDRNSGSVLYLLLPSARSIA